ncbi:hypothetical protein Hdeb2414_s0005g00168201 [Helianthus debilis subsp. tardiflorus]
MNNRNEPPPLFGGGVAIKKETRKRKRLREGDREEKEGEPAVVVLTGGPRFGPVVVYSDRWSIHLSGGYKSGGEREERDEERESNRKMRSS